MACSDFSLPVVANHRVLPGQSGPKRRAMSPLTMNQLNSAPTSRVISSTVRRCLFGISQVEDTENLYKFVIDEACEKFAEKYNFNPREYCPVESESSKFKWEKVDENTWRAANVSSLQRVVKPSRSIRLGEPSSQISTPLAVPVNNNDIQMALTDEREEAARERLSFPESVEKSVPLKKANGVNRPSTKPRQTLLSDYMTPRKRKSETCPKAAAFDLVKPEPVSMAKRSKIANYFKQPTQSCKI